MFIAAVTYLGIELNFLLIHRKTYKFKRIQLIFSLAKDKVNTARFLIENGADTHIKDNSNMTALFIAAEQGDLSYFKTLFSKDKAKKFQL